MWPGQPQYDPYVVVERSAFVGRAVSLSPGEWLAWTGPACSVAWETGFLAACAAATAGAVPVRLLFAPCRCLLGSTSRGYPGPPWSASQAAWSPHCFAGGAGVGSRGK